jgi:hypothetical protein
MDAYLNGLRTKRTAVQAAINAEYARPYPDALVLAELKKRKLRLREKIERIEGKSIPWGVPAPHQPWVAMRSL